MKIEGTILSFDIYEVLRNATPEQCRELADALSLHDDVRKRVIDSIIDGETDLHSSQTWVVTDSERKRILEARGQMTDDRIRHLECDIEVNKAQLAVRDAQNQLLWDIYHSVSRVGVDAAVSPSTLYRVLSSGRPDFGRAQEPEANLPGAGDTCPNCGRKGCAANNAPDSKRTREMVQACREDGYWYWRGKARTVSCDVVAVATGA